MRLRNIDNGARHASYEDHTSRALSFHEVAGHGCSKQICTVDVYAPEFAQAINWIVDSFKIFGESGRGDEVVNLTVGLDDLRNTRLDRVWIGNIGIVRCNIWNMLGAGIFFLKCLNEQIALLLSLVL